MKLTPEETEARLFVEGLALEVVPIPPSRSKTPEFFVNNDGRGYVVEVKSRRDGEKWTRALRRGEVAFESRPFGHDRWTMDVARAALKQCRSADPGHGRWWVLWISITCSAATEAMVEQVIGSLLGVKHVVYLEGENGSHLTRKCLGVVPGVFERHPDFVACVVSHGKGISFCVNDRAPDVESFQRSIFYNAFASIHPPTSVAYLERNGGLLSVDADHVDRRDQAAVASYLEQKYGFRKALVIDMTDHSASVLVPGAEA